MRKEDQLWKGIIESIFTDFIRFIHPGIDEFLDLNRGVEFLDKELEQVYSESGVNAINYVDKLVKVYTHEGQLEWILLHFEIQAVHQKDFSERMFRYFYRLFDKYNKPISAYAIFTESTPKERQNVFQIAFLGTNLSYQFNTYKITDATDEELWANENPFALVILAARTVFAGKHIKNNHEHDQLIIALNTEIVRQLISRNIEQNKIIAILIFLKGYIKFKNQESNRTFNDKLEMLTIDTNKMGIEEMVIEMAKETAKNEQLSKFLKRLTDLNFPQEEIEKILELTAIQIKNLQDTGDVVRYS